MEPAKVADSLVEALRGQEASAQAQPERLFKPGERVYAWLASGQNVSKGAYLTSNNAGLLTLASVAASVRLARALEAVDTSGSAPVAGTRIRVEIV